MAALDDGRDPARSSESVDAEPPAKRQRLLGQQQTTTNSKMAELSNSQSHDELMKSDVKMSLKSESLPVDTKFEPDNREAEAGILYFVNDNSLGFSGTLKQRYILPSKSSSHLERLFSDFRSDHYWVLLVRIMVLA
jgi:hypothetical protein